MTAEPRGRVLLVPRGVRLAAAVATGAAAGVGAGLLLIAANWGAIAVAALCGLALGVAVRRVDVTYRHWLALITAGAFAIRLGLGQVIHSASLAMGRGGFVTGDDSDYALMATAVSRYLRGDPLQPFVPPLWAGNDYLVGTFVYIETTIFLIFGPNVPVMLVLNAAISALTLLVLFDLGRRLVGARPALIAIGLIAIYPSLVLWSSLNLKDALAGLIAAVALWLLRRFVERPRTLLFAALFFVLLPLEGLRKYLFVGLVLVAPIAVAAGLRVQWPRRVIWSGASVAASTAYLLVLGYSGWLQPAGLSSLEVIRAAMASGARTAYYEPLPVGASAGTTFVVPGRGEGRIVHVSPGTTVVLATPSPAAGAPSASPDPAGPRPVAVVVRPGDIVVVGPPETTPAPPLHRRTLNFNDQREGRPTTQIGTDPSRGTSGNSDALVLERTIAHIPRGLAYALGAPFVWEARRPSELAAVPEMLIWYAALVAAAWTLWIERRRWRELLPLALFITGLIGIFVLTEGNVGILFRHRGMVIPFVLMLAAPGLLQAAGAIRRKVPAPPRKALRTP